MPNEKYKFELAIERFFTRLWKFVINLEKYLTTPPKNKMELNDKRFTMIITVAPILLFLIAVFWRG